jgi:hypothetical protein
VTRSVAVSGKDTAISPANSGWRFATGVSIVMMLVVGASLPIWGPASFGVSYLTLAPPLLCGIGIFVFMATVSGSLAGSDSWTGVAFIIGLDGILRLVSVTVALLLTQDPVLLAWMVVAPLPITLAISVVVFRRSLRSTMILADSQRTLVWNVVRTMTASAGSAILITGFPLVLALVSSDSQQDELAPLILAITLTRAPLLMPLSAFQGFLVVQFAKTPARQWRLLAFLGGGLVVLGSIGALLAWLVGPVLLESFFGQSYVLDGELLALLVGAAAAIAGLYVTGPAVLARGGHAGYALGWIGAVTFALVTLCVPGDLNSRAIAALAIGPLIGMAIHIAFLLMARNRHSTSGFEASRTAAGA